MVFDSWVGRPSGPVPVKTRTSHTSGRFSRSVAMREHDGPRAGRVSRDDPWNRPRLRGAAGAAECVALLDAQARYRPSEDELLDLAGALEDRVDLGVAVPALDGVLPRVAV